MWLKALQVKIWEKPQMYKALLLLAFILVSFSYPLLFDTEEQLIQVKNQNGERYELKRDQLGRIIAEIDYYKQRREYEYSLAGHLLSSVDPLGNQIKFTTDSLGRITKKEFSSPLKLNYVETETFQYDLSGNLVACENAQTKVTREFDEEGRLLQETQGDDFRIDYAYDQSGRLTGRTTNYRQAEGNWQSRELNYGYDPLGQVDSLRLPGQEPIGFERNALGQIVRESLSPELRRELGYNPAGYLTSQAVLTAAGPLLRQTYAYDATGNLVNKWDSLYKDEYFSYSRVGRLASYTDPQRREQDYPTDPAGNLLKTKAYYGYLTGYAKKQWSREGRIFADNDYQDYRFDPTGNLVERRSDDQGKTEFIWDGFGRLAQSINKGVTTVYRYDALSRRISKETDGVSSKFYWDGEALVGDELVSGTGVSTRQREWTYYPGSFEPLSMWLKDEHGRENSYFYQNAPNGCPERLFDKAGKVVWAAQYNGWGLIERFHVQEVDQPLRLQGQFFDEETGNCYNRYRYYDPRIGAFISADPISLAGGLNNYEYGPNICRYTDPLGLCKKKVEVPKPITDPSRLLPAPEQCTFNVGERVVGKDSFEDFINNEETFRLARKDYKGFFFNKPGANKSNDSWNAAVKAGFTEDNLNDLINSAEPELVRIRFKLDKVNTIIVPGKSKVLNGVGDNIEIGKDGVNELYTGLGKTQSVYGELTQDEFVGSNVVFDQSDIVEIIPLGRVKK